MKLEKKIVIGVTEEERNILREIRDTVEEAFNMSIDDNSETFSQTFSEIVSRICEGYGTAYTPMGGIQIKYEI